MSKSLSDSSRDMSSSSSRAREAYAKADQRNSMWGRSNDSALSELGTFDDFDKQLRAMRTLEALQSKRDGMNPVEGLFYDPWVELIGGPDSPDRGEPRSLMDALQAPYDRRVERAGGAPFEGPIDWGGIGAAIFGGQSAAERDAAILAGRAPVEPRFDPINPLGGPSWEQFDDYVNNTDAFGPRRDPESGFVLDPETGTYYREDMFPSSETRLAENPVASQPFPSFAPLQGLMDGIAAEGARWNGDTVPPLPRPDPRGGIIQVAENLPGQVEGDLPIEIEVRGGNGLEESDEARYAREHPVAPKKESTVFDKAVEMGGSLLENTALGGIAKNLFPDLWYGTGEVIKGLDDGVNYGSGTRSAGTQFEYMPQNGSLSEQAPSSDGGYYPYPLGFPDANGNGIDDRLEGYKPSTAPNTRIASFPTMPPYNPGRDNEWTYFTNNRLAGGGVVHAYAEGGPVATEDPRMQVIAEAEDVLEKIATGSKPDEQDAKVLKAFVAKFGDGALRSLNDNVKAGMKMNPSGRMISGPGGPTDDAIPALIDGHAPAALSDGEFVMPAAAVAAAGDGDPERGAEALQELSERLSRAAGDAELEKSRQSPEGREQLLRMLGPDAPLAGSARYSWPGQPGTGARSKRTGTVTGGGF